MILTRYIFIFFFLLPLNSWSQNFETSIILDTLPDQLIQCKAVVLSELTSDQSYSYEFLIIKTGNNSSTNRQRGEFTLEKGELVLSSHTVNISEGEQLKAKLFIYEGQTVKSTASYGFQETPASSNSDMASSASEKDASLDEVTFILDDTRTRAGRDFYDLFYRFWQDLEMYSDQPISIKEQFIRGGNTRIEITLGDDIVFVSGLSNRYDAIEARAQSATRRVAYQVERRNRVSSDLEKSEMKGTGI